MRVSKIKLINFRNYASLNVEFDKGINLIYGRNASGKTNLVESIGFSSLGKSFRTNEDELLIKDGEKASRIEIEYFRKQKNYLEIILNHEGKTIIKNDIKLNRLSELSGNLISLTFIPEDVLLFKDSPIVRRRFLDVSIASLYRRYINQLGNYKSLLKQRNITLKEENVNEEYLEVLDEQMISLQYDIVSYRSQVIKLLEQKINNVFKNITSKEDELKIKYVCDFKDDLSFEEFKKQAKLIYQKDRFMDIKRKNTSSGVHKDDFKVYLNSKDVGEYASQGQNRIISLCLKLSYGEMVKDVIHEDPIIILDDVLSELDMLHQEKLISYLRKYEQVFITSAKEENIENINKYQVLDSVVMRRN